LTGVSLNLLVKALSPVVKLLEAVTRMLRPRRREPSVTRAELLAMARVSAQEGGLDPDESRIFANLLQLDRVKVREVMTPRTIVQALPRASTVGEVRDNHERLRCSRIPVYGDSIDDVQGYVLRHDLLERAAAGRLDVRLEELARPLGALPASSTVAHALDRFIAEKDHLFLVVDEFGGTAGLVTLEDALETLLGREIVDESDSVADLQALARRRYQQALRRLASYQDRPDGT
jgi:CBS domain containing-hemolysin-like protein